MKFEAKYGDFSKKSFSKRGYPQIILKTVRVRAFAQISYSGTFWSTNILQVTARLYLLYFPRYGRFLVCQKFRKIEPFKLLS